MKVEFIKFIVLRKGSIAIESVERAESAVGIMGRDGAILKVDFSGNKGGGDCLESMVPCSVVEARDDGAWRNVVKMYAAFVSAYTKFIDD